MPPAWKNKKPKKNSKNKQKNPRSGHRRRSRLIVVVDGVTAPASSSLLAVPPPPAILPRLIHGGGRVAGCRIRGGDSHCRRIRAGTAGGHPSLPVRPPDPPPACSCRHRGGEGWEEPRPPVVARPPALVAAEKGRGGEKLRPPVIGRSPAGSTAHAFPSLPGREGEGSRFPRRIRAGGGRPTAGSVRGRPPPPDLCRDGRHRRAVACLHRRAASPWGTAAPKRHE